MYLRPILLCMTRRPTPPPLHNNTISAEVSAELTNWHNLAKAIVQYIPGDVYVHVDDIVETCVPAEYIPYMRKPARFFQVTSYMFDVAQHPLIVAGKTGTIFVRRKDRGGEKGLSPKYCLNPEMILRMAYSVPNEFVPLTVIEDKLKSRIPGLATHGYTPGVIMSGIPSLFEVESVNKPAPDAGVWVRSRVRSFNPLPKKYSKNAGVELIQHIYEAVGQGKKIPMNEIGAMLNAEQLDLVKEITFSVRSLIELHSAYFNCVGAMCTQREDMSQCHRPLSLWYSRIPPLEWVDRRIERFCTDEQKNAAAAAELSGFNLLYQTKKSSSWKKSDNRISEEKLKQHGIDAAEVLTREDMQVIAERIAYSLPEDGVNPSQAVESHISEADLLRIRLWKPKKTITHFFRSFPGHFTLREEMTQKGLPVTVITKSSSDAHATEDSSSSSAQDSQYYDEDVMVALVSKHLKVHQFLDASLVLPNLPIQARRILKAYYGGFHQFLMLRPQFFQIKVVENGPLLIKLLPPTNKGDISSNELGLS